MKKIIILAGLFLLIGAGCGKTQTDSLLGQENNAQNKQTEQKQEVKKLTFEEERVGFNIHYPTFIPDGLALNKEELTSFMAGNYKTSQYRLIDPTDPVKYIAIQERQEDLSEEEKKMIDDDMKLKEFDSGYFTTQKLESGEEIKSVFFSAKNGHFVRLVSEYFDIETLAEVAKSMNN
ncbi:MAG: hypothetical protein A2469_01775 [Candidatus Magasanikbacteria bacterium RIFOXYC2_FULL_40_16]|uniref:DUF4367 domain-containing protein n=3 Tax=Candidatus Magasanikiibacteriota TaxID=1752731 RepID=A0A1F6NGU3_9BACT|nr:MAG: hypothetical protein A2373_02465 [Candidatus Magasanikbacteria bacterium RIFOXYB1_FULL_40_15]OGH85675.1 MAG: hypothetical protein A2301_00155 [Candidatus Magasanikbacteria bacterium RIFOXYB2_FULL_40_13]OGH87904.1 MAG: hypothetical protein A2206_03585 [Candidatus Magasanikbacteria bacterium RIFOXYA1_FULL_40_8]OGH90359.1 MAG: hypothetical protein A2469_01775 [Candidatus Magasanikbacteria bacterium RIFOXYC2_FULL_40_16]